MKALLRIVMIAMLVTTSIVSTGYATPWQAHESKIYPGSPMVPAMTWLMRGPQVYYAVYEHWPETWQDVVDAGFITETMYDHLGNIISPDDRTWDFNGDVQYSYQGENIPLLVSWSSITNSTGSMPVIISMPTYDGMFRKAVAANHTNEAFLIGDKERQHLMSVCALVDEGTWQFWEAFGRVPASYAELAASGLGPMTPETVNPLTGKPYAGLGEPNDFFFHCEEITPIEQDGGSFSHTIYPVGADGKRWWTGTYL
jgi:hypothetical protein